MMFLRLLFQFSRSSNTERAKKRAKNTDLNEQMDLIRCEVRDFPRYRTNHIYWQPSESLASKHLHQPLLLIEREFNLKKKKNCCGWFWCKELLLVNITAIQRWESREKVLSQYLTEDFLLASFSISVLFLGHEQVFSLATA